MTENSNLNLPFARIEFNGTLIALINSLGTIIYNTNKCEELFGSLSIIIGHNILEFLKINENSKILLEYFQEKKNLLNYNLKKENSNGSMISNMINKYHQQLFHSIQLLYETR